MSSFGGSIASNPLVSNIDITQNGTDFLWMVFAVMLVTAIALIGWGRSRPVGTRAFHHLGAAICFTASIAYFCMAADLGATPIAVEFIRSGSLGQDWVNAGVRNPTRSIWYARYIDWTITTPMLLLEILLATGLPLSEVFTVIFMDLVMIETGLIGSLVHSQYKWGLYTFGCLAEFYIWYVLLVPARASASRLGSEWGKAYVGSAIFLSAVWLLYPIAWGLSDGGNVIKPTSEMVFYGILDLLAKPVFCLYHCYFVGKCDYALLGFSSGKYSESATAEEHAAFSNSNGEKNGFNHSRRSDVSAVDAGVNHHGHSGATSVGPAVGTTATPAATTTHRPTAAATAVEA